MSAVNPPSLDLPAVNGHLGGISEPFLMTLRPLPDLMAQSAQFCQTLIDAGWKQHEVAVRFGLSDAMVHKLIHGQLQYSAPVIEAVMGIRTQEIRLVVPVVASTPPLPGILAVDTALTPIGDGAWAIAPHPGYTLREVATMKGCSLRTIQRRLKDGTLPYYEAVPGRPASHRIARIPDSPELRAWRPEKRHRKRSV